MWSDLTRHRTSLGLRAGGSPLDGLIEKLAITGDQEGAQCEVRRGGAASTGLAEAGRQVASLHPVAAGTPVRAGPATVAGGRSLLWGLGRKDRQCAPNLVQNKAPLERLSFSGEHLLDRMQVNLFGSTVCDVVT